MSCCHLSQVPVGGCVMGWVGLADVHPSLWRPFDLHTIGLFCLVHAEVGAGWRDPAVRSPPRPPTPPTPPTPVGRSTSEGAASAGRCAHSTCSSARVAWLSSRVAGLQARGVVCVGEWRAVTARDWRGRSWRTVGEITRKLQVHLNNRSPKQRGPSEKEEEEEKKMAEHL